MPLIGVWGGDFPYEIWRTGERIDQGGDGTEWSCTCANGTPPEKGPWYGCKHLQDLWKHADKGLLSNSFNYTAEGIHAAEACFCQNAKSPIALRLMPPKQRTAPVQGPQSRNSDCACGSGRWFKKCHGAEGGPPPGAPPYPGDLEPAEPPELPPPPPVPPPTGDKKHQQRQKKIRKADEVARRRLALGPILEKVKAKDEARREKARERRAKKAKP